VVVMIEDGWRYWMMVILLGDGCFVNEEDGDYFMLVKA
jgi:hypothetical protein